MPQYPLGKESRQARLRIDQVVTKNMQSRTKGGLKTPVLHVRKDQVVTKNIRSRTKRLKTPVFFVCGGDHATSVPTPTTA